MEATSEFCLEDFYREDTSTQILPKESDLLPTTILYTNIPFIPETNRRHLSFKKLLNDYSTQFYHSKIQNHERKTTG